MSNVSTISCMGTTEDIPKNAIVKVGVSWSKECQECHSLFERFADTITNMGFDIKFLSLDLDKNGEDGLNKENLLTQISNGMKLPMFLIYKEFDVIEHIIGWHKEKLLAAVHDHFIDSEKVDNSWILKTMTDVEKFIPGLMVKSNLDGIEEGEEEIDPFLEIDDPELMECTHDESCCCVNMDRLNL